MIIDELFLLLKDSGIKAVMLEKILLGLRAFGYADDIALAAPSLSSLKQMIKICEQFTELHGITFNPTKTKLLCFNVKQASVIKMILLS